MNIILDNGAFMPEFAHKTDAGADCVTGKQAFKECSSKEVCRTVKRGTLTPPC